MKNLIIDIFCILLGIGLITLIVSECVIKYKEKKQYGNTNYEIVVIDKYSDIDSKFLIFGAETTYHIVYKWRLTNRPSNPINMEWYTEDEEVQYATYRRIDVGFSFNSSIQYYHFYQNDYRKRNIIKSNF